MDVIVKDEGDRKRLYDLMDKIDQQQDQVTSRLSDLVTQVEEGKTFDEEVRSEIANLKAAVEGWDDIKARMDEMDKSQPKGSKRYIPAGGEYEAMQRKEIRTELSRWLINGASLALTGKKRFDGTEADISQTYSDDAEGGYLVPDLFMQEIQRIAENYGFCRQNFRQIMVPTEQKHVPIYVSGPAVEWADEGEGPENDTAVAFTRATLTTKRLMAVATLSWEIIEWSEPSLVDFMIDITGEKVAAEEDRVGLRGDTNLATDPFDGAITLAGNTYAHPTAGENLFSQITYEDLIYTQDAVSEFVQNSARWVFSNHIRNIIRLIRAGTAVYDTSGTAVVPVNTVGMPLWAMSMANDAPNTLLGSQYSVSAAMPKSGEDGNVDDPVLLFGDFRRAMAIAVGRRMTVRFSEHYDFKNANVVMRFMEMVGFKALLPDAMAVLTVADA